MPETAPSTPDSAGVTRTPTGEIASPPPTSTPPQETIVRPPPTPSTTPSSEKPETSDEKKAEPPGKSLINEKGPEGAPETYESFKVPEGSELRPEVAAEVNALFKKNNLSQASGQELVDFYVKHVQEALQAPVDFYMNKQEEWRKEISNDPEIGGSKLNGTKASVSKLIDSVGDAKLAEAFRAAMDYTGAGNSPDVVRWLTRIAQKLVEGGPVRGGGPSPDGMRPPGVGRPSAAQAIYPNLPSINDRG